MLMAGLAALLIATAIGIPYTLAKVGVRTPFSAKQFVVHVEFADAAGLDEADHPLVAVAGTRQGRVTKVERRDGKSVATIELSPDVDGKVFANASAAIRPAGAIPVLAIDINPGSPADGKLDSGSTITEERSSTFVAPDKVLSMLDTDTRTQLQVLIGQSDKALAGRGDELSKAIIAAAPLAQSAGDVTAAIADRRVLVRRLVAELAVISRTLSERRDTLASAVSAGRRVLRLTAANGPALGETVSELTTMLDETRTALADVQALSGPLKAGLDEAVPALEELPAGLDRLRALAPPTSKLVRDLAELEAIGSKQIPAVRDFTSKLASSATAGRPSVTAAAKTIDTLSNYGDGLAQLGDVISGAVSTNDANGVLARTLFTSIEEVKPENFGFPASTQQSLGARRSRSRLPAMLAAALDDRCKTSVEACVLRVTIPGLPEVGEEK